VGWYTGDMETGPNRIRRTCVHAAEYDLMYWRPVMCYLARTGVTSKIKRQIRRRERRQGKKDTYDRATD